MPRLNSVKGSLRSCHAKTIGVTYRLTRVAGGKVCSGGKMHKIISLIALLFALTVVPTVSAQGPDIFVTPIPNNPFTGTVNVQRLNINADGAKVALKNVREIGRDSRGRIFNEMRTAVAATSNESPERTGVHIYDPETRVSTVINDQQHIFFKNTV